MTEQVNTEQQVADAQEQGADLNINDLNAMKVIIDIASSRGAFKPNEMAVVGTTYNKLTTFLDQVTKQAEAQKAEQPGA
jgi:hypothetical protein